MLPLRVSVVRLGLGRLELGLRLVSLVLGYCYLSIRLA